MEEKLKSLYCNQNGKKQTSSLSELGPWEAEYPHVAAFVAVTSFDGRPRKPGTLCFFLHEDQIKLCLNDRHMGRSAFVTGNGMQECMRIAEKKLSNGTLEFNRANQDETISQSYQRALKERLR